jgi:hypothetical protein
MKYVKTFEEMWPFKKESDIDRNKKILVSICKYLLDYLNRKNLIGYKIKRVEVGYSKVKENIFVIQFFTDTSDIIRFNWQIDKSFKVIDFDSYYLLVNGKVTLHFLKHKSDRLNFEKYQELDSIRDLMIKFFETNKILV